MKRPVIKLITMVLIFTFANGILFAGTTGKIAGMVTDNSTGNPLVGVNVIVGGLSLGAATDINGKFYILNVPPGSYSVTASMMGYQSMEVTDVRVNIDLTANVDFVLSIRALQADEMVTVVATRPLIVKDATATATVVTSEELASSPIETINAIIGTKAGVTVGASGELHFRGGRSDEVLYIIDGVPNRNPYNNSQAIELSTNSVAELSVISGSFNAEYGQAMSGVVNMVTKEGSQKYTGSFAYQVGDLAATYDIDLNKRISDEIGDYDPTNLRELEFSFGGPIPVIGDRSRFFVSGRFFSRKGTLYGLRMYNALGQQINVADSADVVPMNQFDKINMQAKFSHRISDGMKFQYTHVRQDNEWQSYSHYRKFIPDNRLTNFQEGNNNIFKLTHQISSKTFYTVAASIASDETISRTFEDPLDPGLVWSGYLHDDDNYEFAVGGTQNGRSRRKFNTQMIKFDFASQFNESHEIKAGFTYQQHKFSSLSQTVQIDRLAETYTDTNGDGKYTEGEPFIDLYPYDEVWTDDQDDNNDTVYGNRIGGAGNQLMELETSPTEIAFYIQDKIELSDMVINLGFRFDSFDPDANIANDWNIPDLNNVSPATVKKQISPRFSLAYPITDRGKLYFSYGHFFQMPAYSYLYQNADFVVLPGVIKSDMGNADLKPQKTVSYEIGFEQQLADDVAMYVKTFFKDYRNLLGQRRYILPDQREYTLFINRDYGDVKGFTFTLDKRFSNRFSSSIDYTYQVAQGSESDPTQRRRDYRLNIEQEKKVVALSWDQTHAIRFNARFSNPGSWGVAMIGKIESGYPYTPTAANELVRMAEENSANKLPIADFDLTAHKSFKFIAGGKNLIWTMKAKVYNLFDRRNENFVWDSTGRATYSLGRYGGLNTPEWENRPQWYSTPRTVYIGANLEF